MKEYLRGLQHIGIPTESVEKTAEFYKSLGFEEIYRKKNEQHDVSFLKLGSLTIETYKGDTVGKTGAIDHLTIDVSDIEKVFELAKSGGYKMIDSEIHFLDFFEKGVRYFMIEGPSFERVEFNQIL